MTKGIETRHSDGGGTAAIAQTLHRILGAHAIYTTYEAPSDPNSAESDEFRRAVAELVASGKVDLVLDVHGSDYLRPWDVDFGTMGLESLHGRTEVLNELAAALSVEGLENQSLDYFAAKGNTITRMVAALEVPAIQLEINAAWLTPAAGEDATHRYAQLLQGMVRFLAERYDISELPDCRGRP